MIPSTLRITLLVGIFIFFAIILLCLKRREINLKYTLLWLLAGVGMLLVVLFPNILAWTTRLLGIQSTMNGLYIVCLAFVLMILFAITSIISGQRNKIKTLTQELAFLEKRVRELEDKK